MRGAGAVFLNKETARYKYKYFVSFLVYLANKI